MMRLLPFDASWRNSGRLIASLFAATFCIASVQASAATAESTARQTISLDGQWAFALDPGNLGEKEHWWAFISVARKEVIEMSRMAMLFSGRLGNGKILVCTFDVLGNLNEKHPEASYLLQVLLDYVVSEKFEPKMELENILSVSGARRAE